MSLLKHWEWEVIVPDILSGAALTAVAASVGGLLDSFVVVKL